jgi:high affinity Mn2+ porin
MTNVTQWHPGFPAPYSGALSLDPHRNSAETTDLTLYVGARLWKGASVFLAPEIDQGFGLDDTAGAAGFLSGEAYKIGANAPYLRIPRAFIRQVINLGGDERNLEADLLQLPETQTESNLILTVGKFSVVDVFDTNSYAHDPRNDFLNWSIIDAGGFDYAADSWGFTYGGSAEWSEDWWTLRAGVFDLSTIPNGKQPDPEFAQYETDLEFEARHAWFGHPGKFKLLFFSNYGNMGSYADALALGEATRATPSVALVRHFQTRDGAAINFEQEVADDLGVFARVSANDGSKETFDFTDINRSASAGISVRGASWNRSDDTVGVAIVQNAISRVAQEYFAAGGLGVLVGDGNLNYGPERILETYYSLHVLKGVSFSLDYQRIDHPAYNRDRGPVSVYGVRLHAEIL